MELDLQLSAKAVLERKFSADLKGYDAEEVDRFLDLVLADYRKIEGAIAKQIKNLEIEVKTLKQEVRELEDVKVKNKIIEDKLKVLDKNKLVSLERVDLLIRIDKLERALYKEGVNPNKIV